jgi:hypothetical protein
VRLRFVIPVLALGAVVFALPQVLGVLGLALSALIFLLVLLWRHLYFHLLVPPKVRARLLALLDPDAGPPDGARPVESELVERLQLAITARDWRALKALLADDFAAVDANGRRQSAHRYVQTQKMFRRLYPDLEQRFDTVLADPTEPDVLWLRTVRQGRPRRGPALAATSWGRLMLAPGARRVRGLEAAAVVRVD